MKSSLYSCWEEESEAGRESSLPIQVVEEAKSALLQKRNSKRTLINNELRHKTNILECVNNYSNICLSSGGNGAFFLQ